MIYCIPINTVIHKLYSNLEENRWEKIRRARLHGSRPLMIISRITIEHVCVGGLFQWPLDHLPYTWICMVHHYSREKLLPFLTILYIIDFEIHYKYKCMYWFYYSQPEGFVIHTIESLAFDAQNSLYVEYCWTFFLWRTSWKTFWHLFKWYSSPTFILLYAYLSLPFRFSICLVICNVVRLQQANRVYIQLHFIPLEMPHCIWK